MPRSDDDPDFLQTFTSEGEGKSKSTRIAPLEVGRNGAPVRVFRQEELDPDALESPPAGVRFLLTNDSGELVQKNPDGTVTGVSGAPADAEYVTTTESSLLSNDTAHSTLTGADLHDPAQHGSTHEQGGTDELDVTGLSGELADAQDPKAHQSTHQDGGADELQVDTLAGDNGAAGEVLQTDGSALSFGSVGGNVPDYEEDPNSPFVATSQTSLTCSLGTPTDELLVLTDPTNSGYDRMQINGVTSADYDIVDRSGTVTFSTSNMPVPRPRSRPTMHMRANSFEVSVSTESTNPRSDAFVAGTCAIASSPISQFTLISSSTSNVDTRLRVFSIDV